MDMPRRGILLRSGMKDDVRQSVFRACHPDRSGGIFLADRQTVGEGKAKKEAPRCRLSEGACVHMAAVQ